MVLEINAPSIHKGNELSTAIIERSVKITDASVLAVGDDWTDEDTFKSQCPKNCLLDSGWPMPYTKRITISIGEAESGNYYQARP